MKYDRQQSKSQTTTISCETFPAIGTGVVELIYSINSHINLKQDYFLQKEARVCVSNAFVLEDSMFK